MQAGLVVVLKIDRVVWGSASVIAVLPASGAAAAVQYVHKRPCISQFMTSVCTFAARCTFVWLSHSSEVASRPHVDSPCSSLMIAGVCWLDSGTNTCFVTLCVCLLYHDV